MIEMTNRTWIPGLLSVVLMIQTVQAADIEVPPGDGTLATAIGTASNGDTLILQTGQYTGDTLVDKSLVIRAESRLDEPYISGSFNIQGDGIEVTLQGLQFNTDLVLTEAADIRILENKLHGGTNIDATAYTTAGSRLLIVGNWLSHGSEILGVGISGAYVAGNVLQYGRIIIKAPAWVVGNKAQYNDAGVISVDIAGDAYVIGNRLQLHASQAKAAYGIYIGAATKVTVAGNVVEMTWENGYRTTVGFGYRYFYTVPYGIYVEGVAPYIETLNNVVVGNSYQNDWVVNGRGVAGADLIVGNIFDSIRGGAASGDRIEYNLCFQNTCDEADGNINADPQFIDTDDLRLAEDSPAIDAGPPDALYADLDLTRNDIGAYGGPWNIEQFDIQRDPTTIGPFVYPMFFAEDGVSANGLQLRVLGVARLR